MLEISATHIIIDPRSPAAVPRLRPVAAGAVVQTFRCSTAIAEFYLQSRFLYNIIIIINYVR